MKIARRVGKFSRWAVAAVMALELAQPAIAQPPRPMNSARLAAMPVINNDDDVAINVQIAWLGDPALFCCHLIAKETPEGLELVGYVPNEAVRQKAIHIAKSIAGDKIVNHLRIQAGMPIPLSRPAAPAELAPQASTILAEALGEKVIGLRITSPAAGKVEITGAVPTAEDKLLISKSLKKLNGCIYVVNSVNATGSHESAALVGQIPLMKTMPAPKPEPEPARPLVMTMPEPMQKPMKSSNVVSAPPIIQAEPMPHMPPAPAPTKPKAAIPAVVKSEPIVDVDVPPSPIAKVKNDVPAEIKPTEPIVETNAPKLGSASVTDLPMDMVPKAASPIIVPPPVKPMVVEPVPVVKNEIPKPIVVEPPVVVKNDPPKVTATPTSAFNPLKVKTESKPIEIVKKTEPEAPKLPVIEPVLPNPAMMVELPKAIEVQPRPIKDETPTPKKIDLLPEAPKVVVADMPKKTERTPEVAKPVVDQSRTTILIPELPKPSITILPAPKPEPSNTAKPGTAGVSDLKPVEVAQEAPKLSMPEAAPLETKKPASVSVLDLPANVVKAETPKLPVPEAPMVETPKIGTASISDLPANVVKAELPKPVMPAVAPIDTPKMGTASVSDLPSQIVEKELPKPTLPVVATPKAEPAKTDRFVPPAPPVVPTKSIQYDATPPAALPVIKHTEPALSSTSIKDNKITGILRQPGSAGSTLDPTTVRKAIEDLCRGSAENISVRETAGRQLTVGMKVANQAEWDRLYAKVKNLPEVAGYSVIYNVSVESTPAKSAAKMEPMRGIIRTSAISDPVDGDAVKKVIENMCVGHADDIVVKTTGKHQVTVAMKVRSSSEWDKLYKQIKTLPEVAGYAVIYNVSVK